MKTKSITKATPRSVIRNERKPEKRKTESIVSTSVDKDIVVVYADEVERLRFEEYRGIFKEWS